MIAYGDLTDDEVESLQSLTVARGWGVLFSKALRHQEALRQALQNETNTREQDLILKGQLREVEALLSLSENLDLRASRKDRDAYQD